MARVGVDVGGTNTDLVLESERGMHVHKVASTPHDQSEGVLRGLSELCEMARVRPGDIDLIVHGTTVATNITIEHSGAEVGMLTTRNFRDILHIGRHKRPHNFSLHFEVPWQNRPLVKRRNRIPITERILPPDGRVETPLAEDEVLEAIAVFRRRGIESVVIGFLFSFINDAHERRAKAIVEREMPGAYVCCSSDVANVIREFERFSTAAMNAFIGPRTTTYLHNLQSRLADNGFQANLRLIQSNGGISTVEACSKRAVSILMSGPAGGVIGGRSEGLLCDSRNLITVDIGGTSADISTIPDGRIKIMNPRDSYVSGHPILVPMIDLVTIGAGGGSIAHIDPAGGFHVGPRSAGADPGPACYGKGGEEPTVTDAQVALGRMDADKLLGGDLPVDPSLAERAIEAKVARKLDIPVKEAALGIIRVINSNMALAIRSNSVARGSTRASSPWCRSGARGHCTEWRSRKPSRPGTSSCRSPRGSPPPWDCSRPTCSTSTRARSSPPSPTSTRTPCGVSTRWSRSWWRSAATTSRTTACRPSGRGTSASRSAATTARASSCGRTSRRARSPRRG